MLIFFRPHRTPPSLTFIVLATCGLEYHDELRALSEYRRRGITSDRRQLGTAVTLVRWIERVRSGMAGERRRTVAARLELIT